MLTMAAPPSNTWAVQAFIGDEIPMPEEDQQRVADTLSFHNLNNDSSLITLSANHPFWRAQKNDSCMSV